MINEVLDMMGAYEHATCVGLPEIVMHTNTEDCMRALKTVSDYFKKEREFYSLAKEFTEVLSILLMGWSCFV